MVNTTISRNSATGPWGAGVGYHCNATFRNVTIADNVGDRVGGIFIPPQNHCDPEVYGIKAVNTILSGNEGGEAADCIGEGPLVSEGHNMLGDVSACDALIHPTDLFVDPMLEPFTDDGTAGNGHYSPMKGSSAVDGADISSCMPFDQIGNPRHDGDGDGVIVCDVGAIEYQGEQYEVAIDFKPGNARNTINPRERGRFWLAVLSGDDVDAPQVDPWSVALGAGEAAPDRYRIRDVNRDRAADLVLRFRTPAVGIVCGDTTLEFVGQTYAGDGVHGADMIRTVGCKAKGNKRNRK